MNPFEVGATGDIIIFKVMKVRASVIDKSSHFLFCAIRKPNVSKLLYWNQCPNNMCLFIPCRVKWRQYLRTCPRVLLSPLLNMTAMCTKMPAKWPHCCPIGPLNTLRLVMRKYFFPSVILIFYIWLDRWSLDLFNSLFFSAILVWICIWRVTVKAPAGVTICSCVFSVQRQGGGHGRPQVWNTDFWSGSVCYVGTKSCASDCNVQ